MTNERITTYATSKEKETLENIQESMKQEYKENISYSTLIKLAIQVLAKLSTQEIKQEYNNYIKIE